MAPLEIRPNSYPEHEHISNVPKLRVRGPAYVGYANIENRLNSFTEWPTYVEQKPQDLAAAGFFYNGKKDQTICFNCGGGLKDWADDDDPWEQHAKWFSKCGFLREHKDQEYISEICNKNKPFLSPEQAANLQIPTINNLNVTQTEIIIKKDTSKYIIEIMPNSCPEQEDVSPPTYPKLSSLENRLASFNNWPRALHQKPNELAVAGFFYSGKGDQTICFYCKGGLKDWTERDVPWEQHAKWFPKCNFVREQKGQDYILEVCKKENVPQTTNLIHAMGNLNLNEDKESSENKESDSRSLCKICYEKEVGVVFLPCGHVVACVDCAPALKICPVCCEALRASVRVFLSP